MAHGIRPKLCVNVFALDTPHPKQFPLTQLVYFTLPESAETSATIAQRLENDGL